MWIRTARHHFSLDKVTRTIISCDGELHIYFVDNGRIMLRDEEAKQVLEYLDSIAAPTWTLEIPEVMNGWLFPSGKFLPCEIGKHGEVAQTLKPGRYIHIFPNGAFSDLPPTKRQREWLIKSLEKNRSEIYKGSVQIILEKHDNF